MSLSKDVSRTCVDAFEMGLYGERKLTQIELMENISWIRGRYKKLFWEAYKCGIWTREQKAAQQTVALDDSPISASE
jgi:hypothetical protein